MVASPRLVGWFKKDVELGVRTGRRYSYVGEGFIYTLELRIL